MKQKVNEKGRRNSPGCEQCGPEWAREGVDKEVKSHETSTMPPNSFPSWKFDIQPAVLEVAKNRTSSSKHLKTQNKSN